MYKIITESLTFHLMVGLSLFFGLTINSCNAQDQKAKELYVQKEWFKSHPSPTVDLEGKLKKIEKPLGPNTREIWYVFQTEQDTLPIYDPENLIRKEFRKSRKVTISGKIVDLEKEGFSKEIWIGYIKN